MIVMWLFLTMPWVCLQFVSVLFPDHSHYAIFDKQKSLHFKKITLKNNWLKLNTTSFRIVSISFSLILSMSNYTMWVLYLATSFETSKLGYNTECVRNTARHCPSGSV